MQSFRQHLDPSPFTPDELESLITMQEKAFRAGLRRGVELVARGAITEANAALDAAAQTAAILTALKGMRS